MIAATVTASHGRTRVKRLTCGRESTVTCMV
jgi:hypothetical protein